MGNAHDGRVSESAVTSKQAQALRTRPKPKPKKEPPPPEPLPEFPLMYLPAPAVALAEELAVSMSVAPDMTAMATLGAMTACTSGRFVIQVDPDWSVGTSVYLLATRGSGGKKSPAVKLAYRALRQTQADLWDLWKIQDKDSRGPSPRVMIRGNATGEGLGLHWQSTGGRAHICDSEGAWWNILAGRYSEHPTWDEMLSGWDGDTYEVIRAGRPSFVVEEAWLSIFTLVQPTALNELAAKPQAEDLGILARILATSIPDVPADVRAPSVSAETLANWGAWISTCARTFWGLSRPFNIRMTGSARDLLYDVQQEYIDLQEDGQLLARHRSWANKAAGHVVALAGIVSRCERIQSSWGEPLTVEDLLAGISLMEYFRARVPECYPSAPTPGQREAALLTPWIRRQAAPWGRRDAWRGRRGITPTAADLQPAIDHLLDLGAIAVVDEAEPGAAQRFGHEKYARYSVADPALLP